MNPAVDHVGVALNVEAVAQQRTRAGAPAGTAVVADREIAGRVRGGVEWRPEHGLSVAVIARPVTLDPSHADAAVLAAALAARSAADELLGEAACSWPDVVTVATAGMTIRVGATTLLGPGRVEAAILVVRIGFDDVGAWARDQLADRIVDRLRDTATMLDRPEELRAVYVRHCGTLGARVRVGLLPHGAHRGRATDVRVDGCLVVTTAGGTDEAVPMSSVASVETVA